MEEAAAKILIKAVELDDKRRLTEAKILYQEGIQLLYDYTKTLENSEIRKVYGSKIEAYLTRAEAIKKKIQEESTNGSYHERIEILNDSTGHSYESVFGRFFDSEVKSIIVEDPYIRANHQRQNFLRFCELAVKKCTNLKTVELITTEDNASKKLEQVKWLNQFKDELITRHKINLSFKFSSTLHDRQIILSNGWIIQIGRGLDYFKAPENAFCSLGQYDLDLRYCHQTVVDIYHRKTVTSKLS